MGLIADHVELVRLECVFGQRFVRSVKKQQSCKHHGQTQAASLFQMWCRHSLLVQLTPIIHRLCLHCGNGWVATKGDIILNFFSIQRSGWKDYLLWVCFFFLDHYSHCSVVGRVLEPIPVAYRRRQGTPLEEGSAPCSRVPQQLFWHLSCY